MHTIGRPPTAWSHQPHDAPALSQVRAPLLLEALNEDPGLAVAVIHWGGHGRQQPFFAPIGRTLSVCVDMRATDGWLSQFCRLIVEDSQITGAHMHEERHGHAGCPECTPPGPLANGCGRY